MPDMRLWTPVANAYEAYRRRLIADPTSVYEHIWRLIHIHESLVVTLGASFASRLLSVWKDNPNYLIEANRLRRKITGLSSPTDSNSDEDLSTGDACLDGYIKPWIDLIKDFSSSDLNEASPFCLAVAAYANERLEQPVAFIEAWKKIAEVPQVFAAGLSRIDRYDAINTLRNKLAHVPVPHKVLHDLHWGIRQEVFTLMTPEYRATNDSPTSDFETTRWHSILRGRLLFGTHYVNGSAFGQLSPENQDTSRLARQMWQTQDGLEEWIVSPFVRIDAELKVSLLFLLNDVRKDPTSEEFKGEYHRFAAELMPVEKERVTKSQVIGWIPVAPPKADTPVLPDSPTDGAPVAEEAQEPVDDSSQLANRPAHELRSIAESAFRTRNYRHAVNAFDQLASAGDVARYNDVARSKHGAALWRFAESENVPPDDRMGMLNRAIELLDSATNHRDPDYRARAFYEKSKALWHKWKYNPSDIAILRNALECAGDAATLQYESAYVSWYEKVKDDLDVRSSRNGEQSDARERPASSDISGESIAAAP